MKIRIIILLIILAVCYLATSTSAQTIEYKGTGILHVQQGDTVIILPKKAKVINQNIYDTGWKAIGYVKSNTQDTIVTRKEKEIKRLNVVIEKKDALIDSCTLERKNFIIESQTTIRTLRLQNSKQKHTIEDIERIAKKQSKELMKIKREVGFWKIGSSGIIAALLGKIGYDYFTN